MESLDEVRANSGRLDREIVRSMAERGGFVRQAARVKTSHADVEAPKRVERVVAEVRALAAEAGLEPRVAEATHRAMIAAFIEGEREASRSSPDRDAAPPGPSRDAGSGVPGAPAQTRRGGRGAPARTL